MAISPLYLDGVPVESYLKARVKNERTGAKSRTDMFWSTDQRQANVDQRHCVQVNFPGVRPVNSIQFNTAHFPHVVTAEYWDDLRNDWYPVLTLKGDLSKIDLGLDIAAQRRKWEGAPVKFNVLDSQPRVVNTSGYPGHVRTEEHPQHFGPGHWMPVSWKCAPVATRAIRLVFSRVWTGGNPLRPSGSTNDPAPYSLGARDLRVGYRVYDRADLPAAAYIISSDFASSMDLLGSPVSFRLREQKPSNVLESVDSLVWRSEPQPVNYAVVNFYADTRDVSGAGQVIDRFYLDPLTTGPTMNIYYSNDEPDATFTADDSPLEFPIATVKGTAMKQEMDPLTNLADSVTFSDHETAYVNIDNTYLQFDPSRPWWLGMSQVAAKSATDSLTQDPWFTFGQNVLRQNEDRVEFLVDSGTTRASVALEEGFHLKGAPFSVALVYVPEGMQVPETIPAAGEGQGATEAGEDPESIGVGSAQTSGIRYPSGAVTLIVRSADGQIRTDSVQAAFDPRSRPPLLAFGRYANESAPGYSGMILKRAVLKIDVVPREAEIIAFTETPELFTRKPAFPGTDLDLTDSALLRMDAQFATPATNVAGLVGGPGNRFEEMTWTPISRDFLLRRGFVHLPPTRARYWNFEFTNLIAEPYDSFVPIKRTIRLFSATTVATYNRVTTGTPEPAVPGASSPAYDYSDNPGYPTLLSPDDIDRYQSAVTLLAADDSDALSPTSGLYVEDPQAQQAAAARGWIWSFAPWHAGVIAPKFTYTQKHEYEKVEVEHRTKVGFFVGLKTLNAYRVDYSVDTEVDQYVEHFLDAENIDAETISGIEIGRVDAADGQNGGLHATGASGLVESKVLPTGREVRALQFATVQTENTPMLPDDGFLDPDLSEHWSLYGDATLTRLDSEGIRVDRGWYQRTYGLVEDEPDLGVYGRLEGKRYAEIEGALPSGLVGGGLTSEPVAPSPSGRIYAAVRVQAGPSPLAGPIHLDIISVETGEVLATAQQDLGANEQATIWTGHSVGAVTHTPTYGELEAYTYGELEVDDNPDDLYGTPRTYGRLQLDPILGEVFVRAYQSVQSQDSFTIARLSLFDAPIAWGFSVDGGGTWHDPLDVRGDPNGVLSFGGRGGQLKWRVKTFHPDATVSALVIRPWYVGSLGAIPGNLGHAVSGPNRSVTDDYPQIYDDPMWQQQTGPIPTWWRTDPVAPTYKPPAEVGGGTTVVPGPGESTGELLDLVLDVGGQEPVDTWTIEVYAITVLRTNYSIDPALENTMASEWVGVVHYQPVDQPGPVIDADGGFADWTPSDVVDGGTPETTPDERIDGGTPR